MKKIAFLFLSLFFMVSCQAGGNYPRVSLMQSDEIESTIIKNKTTLNELFAKWGPPTSLGESNNQIGCAYRREAPEYRRYVQIFITADKTGLIIDYNYAIGYR